MDWYNEQIVIGSVLGGSSLYKQPKGKNYYLSMRNNNRVWLLYKMEELKKYFDKFELIKVGNTYRCNSKCSEDFSKIYLEMYFKGKRIVNENVFDLIKDIGIAIWFLENGGYAGRNRKNAYLNTTLFGEDGTKLIWEYFNNIFGMPCTINKNKNRKKILFSIEGTRELQELIKPVLPICMIEKGLGV